MFRAKQHIGHKIYKTSNFKFYVNVVLFLCIDAVSVFITYRAFILARSQKAPSVSLLMLFLCSLRTSRLDRPWKVRPSTWRIRFLFSSLQGGQTNKKKIATDHERKISEALNHTYIFVKISPTLQRRKMFFFSPSFDWGMFCPHSTLPSITLKSKPKNPTRFSWR